ncbi:hypothetical protein ACXR8F_17880 [Terrabacter sp. AAH1]|jgi:hypothetical protein
MHRRVAAAGLVAFLAIDIGLVVMALRAGRNAPAASPQVAATLTAPGTAPAGATTPVPSIPPAPSTTTSATTAPTTPASEPSAGVVPVARLVSALDATTAWRATVGSCTAGGARVEVSTDGGATWTRLRSPARAVARVQPMSRTEAFVIGAGAECTPRQYATKDGGETWGPSTVVRGGWARRLDGPTRVLAPRAARATPCGQATVVDLSRTSATQAEALCAGGSVVATKDGGLTWTDAGSAPGAVALGTRLSAGGAPSTYAVRVVARCRGLQVVRVSADQGAAPIGCVGAEAVAPGQVGLSVTAAAGWIVAGDQTWVSSRDLTSWKRA